MHSNVKADIEKINRSYVDYRANLSAELGAHWSTLLSAAGEAIEHEWGNFEVVNDKDVDVFAYNQFLAIRSRFREINSVDFGGENECPGNVEFLMNSAAKFIQFRQDTYPSLRAFLNDGMGWDEWADEQRELAAVADGVGCALEWLKVMDEGFLQREQADRDALQRIEISRKQVATNPAHGN